MRRGGRLEGERETSEVGGRERWREGEMEEGRKTCETVGYSLPPTILVLVMIALNIIAYTRHMSLVS